MPAGIALTCIVLMILPGAHDRNRTGDLILTKDVLCRLSYMGIITVLQAPGNKRHSPSTYQQIRSNRPSPISNIDHGAGNGIRTRDPQLGRLTLYH